MNRLYDPSSDLSAYRWINERIYPREDVEKQWIYRSLDLLAEEKEVIEENIFENLVNSLDLSLDLVFYDLTSSYFEGEGPSRTSDIRGTIGMTGSRLFWELSCAKGSR